MENSSGMPQFIRTCKEKHYPKALKSCLVWCQLFSLSFFLFCRLRHVYTAIFWPLDHFATQFIRKRSKCAFLFYQKVPIKFTSLFRETCLVYRCLYREQKTFMCLSVVERFPVSASCPLMSETSHWKVSCKYIISRCTNCLYVWLKIFIGCLTHPVYKHNKVCSNPSKAWLTSRSRGLLLVTI